MSVVLSKFQTLTAWLGNWLEQMDMVVAVFHRTGHGEYIMSRHLPHRSYQYTGCKLHNVKTLSTTPGEPGCGPKAELTFEIISALQKMELPGKGDVAINIHWSGLSQG